MVMQTQNSITIKWQTPENEIGKVEYGFFPSKFGKSILEKEETNKHSLNISNLKECTKYYYSVSSNSLAIDNNNRSFTTLCKEKNKQLLWVIGDSGEGGENQKKVYSQMLKFIDNDFSKLDMWILLGDNAYKSGTQKQYNKNLFAPYIELVKRFVPWAVIGNHDARRWAFYDIWDFPTNAETGGVPSHNEKFYSINNANLHLIMLDSETQSLDANGEMLKWLKEDLTINTKTWVIVVFHTPPYTDGGHDSDDDYDSGGKMKMMRENFVPIFDEHGVDLVLAGHSHDYERSKLITGHTKKSKFFNTDKHIVEDRKSCYSKPLKITKNSGTIYQVCGSSSKLDIADLKHPALPFSFETMGSLIIELTPTSLTSQFLTIDGIIADKFTIYKNNITCRNKNNE